ncbi:MAG TPA: hypothetical protein VLS89_04770 [Candidatus Nanopelagicales bacterium]|nr:hypothetical protein [Candidatus Nanopelagicales bacterium]
MAGGALCYRSFVAQNLSAPHRFAAAVLTGCMLALVPAAGCATTEYVNEGPGQPTERASGALPPGAVGVCKEPFTKRPPIVPQDLWDHAKPCAPSTPASYIRLGYAKDGAAGQDPETEQLVERTLAALREGNKVDGGNSELLSAIRAVRSWAIKKDQLRSRVTREPQLEHTCDFTYLLNTMSGSRGKLKPNEPCTAKVFDPQVRDQVCLFDTGKPESLWLTSGWDCVTFTGALGNEESCHRLCGYDDYCTRQVYCAAGDIDLLLCTMGVCLPEPRRGIY